MIELAFARLIVVSGSPPRDVIINQFPLQPASTQQVRRRFFLSSNFAIICRDAKSVVPSLNLRHAAGSLAVPDRLYRKASFLDLPPSAFRVTYTLPSLAKRGLFIDFGPQNLYTFLVNVQNLQKF